MKASFLATFRILMFLTTVLPSGLVSAEEALAPTTLEWKFRVFLDKKEIGQHDFTVVQEGPLITLKTVASFDVKIFFFTAYTYRHNNVETYDPVGLVSIDAFTNANGDEFVVDGERQAEAFILKDGSATESLPKSLMTFAYWNPEILNETRLLNSQTGEYEPIEVIERGPDAIKYQDQSIPARQVDLMVQGLPISIWYADSDQRWLALESETESGRILRYEPISLPERAGEVITRFNALN